MLSDLIRCVVLALLLALSFMATAPQPRPIRCLPGTSGGAASRRVRP